MAEQGARKLPAKPGLPSGLSAFAAKLAVPRLSALFIAVAALHANGGVVLAATPQFDSHYAYARSGSCSYSASATCRQRLRVRYAQAVAGSTPNRALVVEFGPGSVRLRGSAESLQLEVHDSTIAAVLAAMGRAFAVRYRSSIPLDDAISGTYVGSLGRVIGRVLAGYDYTIKHQGYAVEVSVLGKHGEQALPAAPAAVTPLRHGRCGRSAGHQAACAPI